MKNTNTHKTLVITAALLMMASLVSGTEIVIVESTYEKSNVSITNVIQKNGSLTGRDKELDKGYRMEVTGFNGETLDKKNFRFEKTVIRYGPNSSEEIDVENPKASVVLNDSSQAYKLVLKNLSNGETVDEYVLREKTSGRSGGLEPLIIGVFVLTGIGILLFYWRRRERMVSYSF